MRKHLLSLSIVACLLAPAFTASAADRDTPERDGRYVSLTAGAAIEAGTMIAVSNGVAYPAADLAGYVVVGRAEATVAAAAKVAAKRGVFRWGNGPAFTAADIGIRCYVNITNGSSSVTSLATSVNKIPAGYIIDVDTSGVWVDTYNDTALISTSVASLAVAGAETVGSTLTVTGLTTLMGNGAANELDSRTATALLLGKDTATSVTLGASDINTDVAGTFNAPRILTVTQSTTSRVCTSADYGKLILIVTNAAVAITLPANGAAAGSVIYFATASRSAALPTTDDCAPTISAASTDTLIGPNDIDLKSVTWGSGHRIGAQSKFWSDGFFWHVQNLGGTTMTYSD